MVFGRTLMSLCRLITDIVKEDLKLFPASSVVEDQRLQSLSLNEAVDRPAFIVQLENAVIKALNIE